MKLVLLLREIVIAHHEMGVAALKLVGVVNKSGRGCKIFAHRLFSTSLVPRPLPAFQCCMHAEKRESWEWPGDEASSAPSFMKS